MTVKNVRLSNGEQLIVDVIEETPEYFLIADALIAAPQGNDQLGFAPFCPLQDPDEKEVKLYKTHVLYMCKLLPQLEQQYCENFGKVSTPTKKLIV